LHSTPTLVYLFLSPSLHPPPSIHPSSPIYTHTQTHTNTQTHTQTHTHTPRALPVAPSLSHTHGRTGLAMESLAGCSDASITAESLWNAV
jgi:hypothetical protein